MLNKEDNKLVTDTGPARPWASSSAASGCPWRSPKSCPARTACRCASTSSARTSSPSVTPTAASAWSTPTARTAARRCSSAATRRTACAASTTAGSSTSTASASTCRTRPKARPSSTRSRSIAYPCVEAGDLIWAYMGPKDKQPPLPRVRVDQACPRATATSPSSASSATTCRPWRATTTRRTPASCTAPSSPPTTPQQHGTSALPAARQPTAASARSDPNDDPYPKRSWATAASRSERPRRRDRGLRRRRASAIGAS